MKLKTIFITMTAALCINVANAQSDAFSGKEIKENRVEKLAQEPCDGIRVVGIGRSTNERSAKSMCLKDAQNEISNLMEAAIENAFEEYIQTVTADDEVIDASIVEELRTVYSGNVISLKKVGSPLKLETKTKSGKKVMMYYQCFETVKTTETIVDEVVDAAEDVISKNSKTKNSLLKDKEKFKKNLNSQLKDNQESIEDTDVQDPETNI